MPAFIVTGLAFGDEGKGLVTDYLARKHKASGVVITNGGAQRAHNVVLPNGIHHTFSQIGSGLFAGAPTYLSKHALVNPHALFIEWEKLEGTGFWPQPGTILADEEALITTPFHVAANRIREMGRGASAHGTCGMGIGETVLAAKNGHELRAKDLKDPKLTREKLTEIQHALLHDISHLLPKVPDQWNGKEAQQLINPQWVIDALEVYRIFVKAVPQYEQLVLDEDETWIFEGGQGVLLDEFYGFHPHTTWSKTTPAERS
jgi:adenylosuccinate synthase